MEPDGPDDVLATFGSWAGGFLQKLNLGAWGKLHNSSPDSISTDHLDAQ